MTDAGKLRGSAKDAGRIALGVYTATLAGALAWLAGIFLAPALAATRPRLSAFLYALYAPVCHQIRTRSFLFHGLPLAVCGRCLGIYAGVLAGLAAYPLVRGLHRAAVLPPLWLLAACSLPIALDVAASWTGFSASSNALRFATGLAWGALLPYYFVPGVAELVSRLLGRKRRDETAGA